MSNPVATAVTADVDREPIITTVLSMAVIVLCGCAVLIPYLGFRCVTVDEYATYLLVTSRGWREILDMGPGIGHQSADPLPAASTLVDDVR